MVAEIAIEPDAERLAAAAAERIVQAARAAVRQRGRFTLVLAGGHTPAKTYSLIAAPPLVGAVDWSRTYLFFGDERFVPDDDPRSNYRMVRETLLARAPIAEDHVLAMPTNVESPAAGAAAYARALAAFFSLPLDGPPPGFDLVLLGLGDDGHTASLFPGAAALNEQRAWVTWSPPGTLPPPVDRVTLTFPTLNAARHVIFLVSGASKAEALREVLEGQASIVRRPAAGVRPTRGILTWLVDKDAARLLNRPQRAQDAN